MTSEPSTIESPAQPGPDQAPGPSDVAGGAARNRRRVLWALALVVALGAAAVFFVRGSGDGEPAGDPGAADLGSWEDAWATGDAEVLRDWFAGNTGNREPLSGRVRGGDIESQEDADRLSGKTVTSRVRVSCDCVLQDFVLEEAMLWVDSGEVTIRDVTLDGQGRPSEIGAFTARRDAEVQLSNVEITGHHDGIRAYADSVSGEYVYIHDPADYNPEDHHQDGIQTIGGSTDFQRSFVDMTGANTSATLIKPDAAEIPSAVINYSVVMGGGYTFHVHDGPEGTPELVDLSDNLVAAGYSSGLVSTWKLTDPEDVLVETHLTVSRTGERIDVEDGARLPEDD